MAIDLKEISEILNISKYASEVYVELLSYGELTKDKIIAFTGFSETIVIKELNNLLKRGYIQKMKNIKGEDIYYSLSLLHLEEKLNREQEAIKHLRNFVLPKIHGREEKIGILKYQSWEGIRKIYVEILEEAIKTGEDIYAFENNIVRSGIGKIFLEAYIDRRIKDKVKAFVFCPKNIDDINYKKTYEGEFTKVKLVDDFLIDANINMVGNLVMSFTVDPPQGTVRRDRSEANTWKSFFKALWDKI